DRRVPATPAGWGGDHLQRFRGRPAALAGRPAHRAAARRGSRSDHGGRPVRGVAGLLRAYDRAGGPGAGQAVPGRLPRGRRGGGRVPSLHRDPAAQRQGGQRGRGHRRAGGCRPAGRPRRDRPHHRHRADTGRGPPLAQGPHRHAAGAGDPARDRGRRRGLLGRAARRRPAHPRARHLRLARLPAGDPGPRRVSL
ncbi:MAG: hypothetical protein AVDCRST_MAG34-2647, partial [uncultured Nocardioidaceae bacterium]